MDADRQPFSEEGIEFLHAGPMVDNGASIGLISNGHVYTMYDTVGHSVNMTYDPWNIPLTQFEIPKDGTAGP